MARDGGVPYAVQRLRVAPVIRAPLRTGWREFCGATLRSSGHTSRSDPQAAENAHLPFPHCPGRFSRHVCTRVQTLSFSYHPLFEPDFDEP
jgi:hypothetical protein